ncbi:hypothetical protein R3W88_016405 [Solanum pinnatisectum]|uniref:Uncharacterized protein n=1 Tax=Solanum pinnatisectum TaxID=50273 RepID=A0AAV9KYG0_9SOLN|nr:hypothetical protein R3W88_016405 [Solanum pinnatisectum]
MEDHTDTTERRESLVNIIIRGPREDQNEENIVTDNRDGGASGDELNSPRGISSKRHKYSVNQIQELEAVLKKNSHPDKKTRLELATNFSVGKKQVQFWFQNKRSILKTQLERHDKRMLQQENEKLCIEYAAMKEFMENSSRDPCRNKDTIRNKNGSLTFMMENFGLELLTGRDETSDINDVDDFSLNEVDFGKYLSSPPPTNLVNKDLTLDKSMLLNLALDALNELLKLAMSDEPFWVRSLDGGGEKLNIEEYARSFIPIIRIKPSHFTTKATRSFGTLAGDSVTLSQWVEMLLCIIGKVNTFDVISTGKGESKSESINLHIETELQIISNVVHVREIQFLRFYQKHAEGTWIIVDVSINTIKEGSNQYKIENCRRLPSGCIIQDVTNCYSKFILIEHMEYDDIFVHNLYRPLISAGLGFGAQSWMSSLRRQSEFLRVMVSFVDSTVDSKVEIGMRILAQRMTRNFCAGICATSHKSQWDILSYSGPIKNIIHITKCNISQIEITRKKLINGNRGDIIANQNSMLIFPETYTDATGSLLVYAIVDSSRMNTLMKEGGGGALLVWNSCPMEFRYGSLVTIRFQMLVDNLSTADLQEKSIIDANDIISHTIHKIKTTLKCK